MREGDTQQALSAFTLSMTTEEETLYVHFYLFTEGYFQYTFVNLYFVEI